MDRFVSRRSFLVQMAGGASALAIQTALGPLSPRAARAQGIALRHLGPAEGATLEALGDTLLPGAAAAGVAHYVDDQLGRESPLLFLKYVDWTGPYGEFYTQGLRSLDATSVARDGVSFASATAEQKSALVREISAANPAGWPGPPAPPAPLLYFVTRNDVLDVVYGTPEGIEKPQVPYMGHIAPPARW